MEKMREAQAKVRHFMEVMGQRVKDTPHTPQIGWKLKELRLSLLSEELWELEEAMTNDDIIAVADALADILYVVLGTAVTYGIDIEPVFDEVHRSNMTKGGLKRADGKVLKTSSYIPPDIKSIIEGQMTTT
jgi:predicted HAD superfamily Cof-like phosphohydrolase